jgi:hypothetical protein
MKDITHVPEVTRIAMTEKLSPKDRVNVPRLTILGITALVLGLGITLYLERYTQWARFCPSLDGTLEEDWSM